MFDVAVEFMTQMVSLIVPVFSIYILFDLIGTLLFGTRWYQWKYMCQI